MLRWHGHRRAASVIMTNLLSRPAPVLARTITGLSTIIWGNDYPHAEGTFRNSAECIAYNFEGVPDADRAAILGGTLADIVGFDKTRKLAA